MITIESAFSQEERRLGIIGRQGENNTRQIAFDCEDILAEYPAAQIICAMQRTTDKEAYLADSTMQDKTLIVTMSDADVSIPGTLRVELRAIIGEDIRKSAVYMAQVVASLIGQGDEPGNSIPDVINRIDDALKEAEKTQKNLQAAIDDAKDAMDEAYAAATRADTAVANLGDAASAKTAAEKAAADAAAIQEDVEEMVDTIAKEPTAQDILAAIRQEVAVLKDLVEFGIGGKSNLNGFYFSRGDKGEFVISYTNPDNDADTAQSTLATKETATLITAELVKINNSLRTMIGSGQTGG